MSKTQFVYVTYIRTTPEKLWRALTDPEFTRQYWAGCWQDSEWKSGASWRIMIPDGRVGDSGEINVKFVKRCCGRSEAIHSIKLRVRFAPRMKLYNALLRGIEAE